MTYRWIFFTLAAVLLSVLCTVDVCAHTGFGMVVDREGRVVFLDSCRSKVWRIEPDGRLTSLANGKHGNTLVQDAAGNLYVQNFNQTLWRIARDGSVTQVELPARNASAGAIGSLDELVAVDRDGNLYVSSGNDFYHRSPQLLKITMTGEVQLVAGSTPGHTDGRGGEAQFSHIRSAAWGPDGALYVADGNSIRRVALDGQVTTLAGSREPGSGSSALENGPWIASRDAAQFNRIFGIAADAAGNVYAADSDNFRIVKLGRDGSLTMLRRTRLPWKPAGVTVAGGSVYVLELAFVPIPMVQSWFTTHRVVRLTPEGDAVTVATVGGGAGYVLGALFAGGVLGAWKLRRRRKTSRAKAAQLESALGHS